MNIEFIPIDNMKFELVVSALSETQDWGQIFVNIPEAHKHSKGEGIVVAVLDTGVPQHDDLAVNQLDGFNCTSSDTALDRQGHSSHVAGIIAACENDSGIIGVAPKSKILPIKVLADNGRSGYENIEQGLRIAIDHNVDIINLSLGSTFIPPDSFYKTVKEAYDKGIIIVAAAGNDSGAVNYPAKFNEIIAVANINQDGNLAPRSSRGDEIAVSAPGTDIYSTYLNNQYAVLSGTSQASPLVAGICALILSWSRNTEGSPKVANTSDMLKMLDQLCDPVGRIGFEGKETNIGFGIPQFANFMPWKS